MCHVIFVCNDIKKIKIACDIWNDLSFSSHCYCLSENVFCAFSCGEQHEESLENIV